VSIRFTLRSRFFGLAHGFVDLGAVVPILWRKLLHWNNFRIATSLWSGLGNHAGKAVISRRYLARQARALIEFAKSTTNPKLAAVLVERAADFKEKADEKMPAPRS